MSHQNDDGEDKIGYGRPPKQTQFKKGESGNPKGRQRKPKQEKIQLMSILKEPRKLKVRGRPVTMMTGELLFRTYVEKALQGDIRSAKMLLDFMAKWGILDKAVESQWDFSGAREELIRKFAALDASDQERQAALNNVPAPDAATSDQDMLNS